MVDRVRTPRGTDEITVTVTGETPARIVGYNFAVGHDADHAELIDVQVGDAVAEHGADLVLTRIENEADPPFGVILVAMDGTAPYGDVLPMDLSGEVELARFVYRLDPGMAPGDAVALELRHRVYGVPPVPAIFVDEDLNSIRPEIQDGEIRVSPEFIRGDCNHDGLFNLSDAMALLLHLFQGSMTPPCLDGCDANDDGELNVTDSLVVLNFLFAEGNAPASPYPQEGVDPSPDGLSCLEIADSAEVASGEVNS